MPGQSYADFDLLIEKSGEGYRVRAFGPLVGEEKAEIRLPFPAPEIGLWAGLAWRGGEPRADPITAGNPAEFGAALFRAVFTGKIETAFQTGLERAIARGENIRLRLRLGEVPELSVLPWEYLFDPDKGTFLCHILSIVRYPELAEPVQPLIVAPPLRVLVVHPRPKDVAPLAGEQEWQDLLAALGGLPEAIQTRIELLDPPTLPALREKVRKEPCQILHFIGHGTFGGETPGGALIFEDEQGLGMRVDAQRLSTLLKSTDNRLRLVVLNACHGARHSAADAFTGVAQDLLRKGIPAVVAMQFGITDPAAVLFARSFYRLLAEYAPVDRAVSEARLAMFAAQHDGEWGTPVLYMRASDGRLFEEPRQTRTWWYAWVSGLLFVVLAMAGLFWRHDQKARTPSDTRRADTSAPSALLASPPDCPSPPGTDIRFVRIEPDSFLMGSRRKGEKPVHKVTLTKPFCLGQFEVTERQWREVLTDRPDLPSSEDDNLPALLSWDEAQIFVQKLNDRAGRKIYRMPTEAEWEYAARAGSYFHYSFGDDPADLYRYGNCKSSQSHEDGYDKRAPVGQFLPNPWQLYDMHGNVWEWVEDWYGPYSSASVVDPTGPPAGRLRVRRGGGYEASAANCQSSSRKGAPSDFKREPVGFRLVQNLE